MIPNLNRATELVVDSAEFSVAIYLKLALDDYEQFDPRAYLLEIAARAIAKAVLSHGAEHEQAVQISAAQSADLIAAGPQPEAPLQAWAECGEWWRLVEWYRDEPHKQVPDGARRRSDQASSAWSENDNLFQETKRRVHFSLQTQAAKEPNMDERYNLNGGFKPPLKRNADLDGPDFYPTPAWVTLALIKHEQFIGDILEPACGDGAMTEVLKGTGCPVVSSDLYDRGYGKAGQDFLKSEQIYDNIVTNPPFHSAEGFVRKGIENSRRKCAFLLRVAFLEGAHRYRMIFALTPPSRVWVFSPRITFYPHDTVQRGNGTTAYAWYVWDKEAPKRTEIRWIEPGYKPRKSSGTR